MTELLDPLPIVRFEVHAVYGLHLAVDHASAPQWFKEAQSASLPREGWRPIYLNTSGFVSLPVGKHDAKSTVTIRRPESWTDKPGDACPDFKMQYSHLLTIREDGIGALTLRLKAGPRQERQYGMNEILATLLLAPRTVSGLKLHEGQPRRQEMASVMPAPVAGGGITEKRPLHQQREANQQAFSPLYALFQEGVREFLANHPWAQWDECCAPSDYLNGLESVLMPETGVGDPQIPYFVVIASVPKRFYSDRFLECGDNTALKRDARSKLTRQIGGILGRWLTPTNVSYVSDEYLQACGLVSDGAFVNKYMNSLSFITYGTTVALCLHPEMCDEDPSYEHLDESALQPQEATYGSILRCVELSRVRWHHALTLSRKLDSLIRDVVNELSTIDFARHLEHLAALRSDAALHFLNPLSYLWDATVGSELAQCLQTGVIESLEKECAQKMDMVRQLIQEQLDVVEARDIESAVRAKQQRAPRD